MTTFELGINTCFAVKRWPEPEAWAEIVRDRLGLEVVQHSLDLVALDVPPESLGRQAKAIRDACSRFGVTLHSTFTGLAVYSANLLLDPDPDLRAHGEEVYRTAIGFTAMAGGRATGGHVGAFSVRDWRDPDRRAELERDLRAALRRVAAEARAAGLEALYVENLAAAREPSTMEGIERLLRPGDAGHAPVVLCLDVGHQCVPGTKGDDRDPYAWLRRFGARAPVVQLQQTDGHADHHWPFTAATEPSGVIRPQAVLEALEASGAEHTVLILEVIPPFEQDDDAVLADLEESAATWRQALSGVAGDRRVPKEPHP